MLLSKGADIRYINAYDNIRDTAKIVSFNNPKIMESIKASFKKYTDRVTKDSGLTIILFADSHLSDDIFIRFSREMSLLRKTHENITGRIFTNGLVILDSEKKELLEKIKILKNKKISVKDNKDALKKIDYEIKQLTYQSEGNFDTHYRWIKKLAKLNLKNLKVQFHPYAFKRMSLDRVPAYLITKCDADFRFKTCRHQAIVRGNISLASFYKILMEEDPVYRKDYNELLK
jgi:hypothetical protein